MTNPWKAKEDALEAKSHGPDDTGGADLMKWVSDINYEYAPGPIDCRCGSLAYWKENIGAHKCPACLIVTA